MRYVIVSVVKNKAGDFNNNLRKDIFEKFKAKSSKLPAYFTIKSPFESEDISELESTLSKFTESHSSAPYKIKGYSNFDNRVIFMKVLMSQDGKRIHDELIDSLNEISYIKFDSKDGKDKIFHVTISSKKIQNIFSIIWDYVNQFPCDFDCVFDNICIYKWENNTWVLHSEYNL